MEGRACMTYRELRELLNDLEEKHLETNVSLFDSKTNSFIPIIQCAILMNVPDVMQLEKNMTTSKEQPVFCFEELNIKIQ
jgi:hypothetical protein